MRAYTVGEVAKLARVTVRALHHYDEIGLLVPSGRSRAGYRLYDDADLRRLHQILLFRELDFPLESIRRLLDDPAWDRASALRAQRALLVERQRRAESVIRAVDRALESTERGVGMSAEELFEGFGDFAHARHAEEAEQRWGETEAYRVSMERTKRYTKRDWSRMKEEMEAVESSWAELLRAGRRPGEAAVVEIAERHRRHIDRWFYPCGHAMHVALAEMYESDPRFRDHYEARAEGLAGFVSASIRANAGRAAG